MILNDKKKDGVKNKNQQNATMNSGKQLRSSFMLLLTAIIWGFAFVAQSVGIDAMGPLTFNGTRNVLGSLVLIPLILIFKKTGVIQGKALTKDAVIGGICCGLCLFVASTVQQYGVMYSTVGKASFITALYVVIVPVMGLFTGKKASFKLWLSVIIAVIGMYFLCIKEEIVLGKGDVLLLLGAFFFSVHILVIDHFSPKANGVVISSIQFMVAGVLSLIGMTIFETPTLQAIQDGWVAIAYAGICSCGIAYTCQIVFQKDLPPTAASLILSLESVFGALGGWLILGQALSGREIAGCIMMFAAIILAQI